MVYFNRWISNILNFINIVFNSFFIFICLIPQLLPQEHSQAPTLCMSTKETHMAEDGTTLETWVWAWLEAWHLALSCGGHTCIGSVRDRRTYSVLSSLAFNRSLLWLMVFSVCIMSNANQVILQNSNILLFGTNLELNPQDNCLIVYQYMLNKLRLTR